MLRLNTRKFTRCKIHKSFDTFKAGDYIWVKLAKEVSLKPNKKNNIIIMSWVLDDKCNELNLVFTNLLNKNCSICGEKLKNEELNKALNLVKIKSTNLINDLLKQTRIMQAKQQDLLDGEYYVNNLKLKSCKFKIKVKNEKVKIESCTAGYIITVTGKKFLLNDFQVAFIQKINEQSINKS